MATKKKAPKPKKIKAAAPPKIQRHQYSNEVLKRAFENNRRSLAKKLARQEEDRMAKARWGLYNAESAAEQAEDVRRSNIVVGGLLPRLQAVMNSWGVNLPVKATQSNRVKGWTDFRSINISYNNVLGQKRHVYNDEGVIETVTTEFVDHELLRQVASEMRGVFYHEVGHIRFTLPLQELVQAALDAGYENTDWIFRHRHTDIEGNTRRVAEPGQPRIQHAWNLLEDQRMENAVVAESPAIAAYFTTMIMRHFTDNPGNSAANFPVLVGRCYLPEALVDASRKAYAQTPTARRLPVEVVEDIVTTYLTTNDPVVMVEQSIRLAEGLEEPMLRELWRMFADNGDSGAKPKGNKELQDLLDQSVTDIPEESLTADQREDGLGGDEDGDDEDAGEGASDEQSRAGKGAGDPDAQPLTLDEEEELEELARKAAEDAKEALAKDATLTEDVASMNEYYAADEGLLAIYTKATPSQGDWTEKADQLASEVEDSFRLATGNLAPVWVSGQTSGVIEAIRYRTRAPGDREFCRNFNDTGNPGADLAVTLLLDISGSMHRHGSMLGATAFAVKEAGDTLGIDTEVILFDSYGYRLWADQDRPEAAVQLACTGGTDPEAALRATLTERRDKRNHVVLIMTDGDWSSKVRLPEFKEDNRLICLLGYNVSKASQENFEQTYEPDEFHRISDLFEIPVILENILVSLA